MTTTATSLRKKRTTSPRATATSIPTVATHRTLAVVAALLQAEAVVIPLEVLMRGSLKKSSRRKMK